MAGVTSEEIQQAVEWKIFQIQSQLICFRKPNRLADKKNGYDDRAASVFSGIIDESVEWFQSRHYDEVVEERITEGVCGYPWCNQKLRQDLSQSKYRIDPSRKRVYEKNGLSLYCCNNCYEDSRKLRSRYNETLPCSRDVALNSRLNTFSTEIDSILNLTLVQHSNEHVNNSETTFCNDLIEEGSRHFVRVAEANKMSNGTYDDHTRFGSGSADVIDCLLNAADSMVTFSAENNIGKVDEAEGLIVGGRDLIIGNRSRRTNNDSNLSRKIISWSEPSHFRGNGNTKMKSTLDSFHRSLTKSVVEQPIKNNVLERNSGVPLPGSCILTKKLSSTNSFTNTFEQCTSTSVEEDSTSDVDSKEISGPSQDNNLSLRVSPISRLRGLTYHPFEAGNSDHTILSSNVNTEESEDSMSVNMFINSSSCSLFLRLWITMDELFSRMSLSQICNNHSEPTKLYDAEGIARTNYRATQLERGLLAAEKLLQIHRHIILDSDKHRYVEVKNRIINFLRTYVRDLNDPAQTVGIDLFSYSRFWQLMGILLVDALMKRLLIGPLSQHNSRHQLHSFESIAESAEFGREQLFRLEPTGQNRKRNGYTLSVEPLPAHGGNNDPECMSKKSEFSVTPVQFWNRTVDTALRSANIALAKTINNDENSRGEKEDCDGSSGRVNSIILPEDDIRALRSYFDYS